VPAEPARLGEARYEVEPLPPPTEEAIHAPDQDIGLLLPSLVQKFWNRFPVEAPKQVDAIGQNNHLMDTNVAYADRLTYTIGLRNQIANKATPARIL
jgi:hypothetical protein